LDLKKGKKEGKKRKRGEDIGGKDIKHHAVLTLHSDAETQREERGGRKREGGGGSDKGKETLADQG